MASVTLLEFRGDKISFQYFATQKISKTIQSFYQNTGLSGYGYGKYKKGSGLCHGFCFIINLN